MKPNRVAILRWIDEVSSSLNEFETQLPVTEEAGIDTASMHCLLSHMRAIRTKAGEFGFRGMEQLAAVGENTLDLLSIKGVTWNSDVLMTLLSTVDAMRDILSDIKFRGDESSFFFQNIIDMFNRVNGDAVSQKAKEKKQVFHPILKSFSRLSRRPTVAAKRIRENNKHQIERIKLNQSPKQQKKQPVTPLESDTTVRNYSVCGYPLASGKGSNDGLYRLTIGLTGTKDQHSSQESVLPKDIGKEIIPPSDLAENVNVIQQSVSCMILAMNNFSGLVNTINQSLLQRVDESKSKPLPDDQIAMYCASIGKR